MTHLLDEVGDEPKKTIYTALLAFQADCPILVKDKTAEISSKTKGTKFSYKYIPLENIMEKIQGLLTVHGLIWTTSPCYWNAESPGEVTGPALSYQLIYAPTGEKIEDTMPLTLSRDADSRVYGSALSYARRQALEAVLNLVAQTDDDGARASGQSKQPTGDARPLRRAEREKVRSAIILAGKDEQGVLTAVGVESMESLTVGGSKAIWQFLGDDAPLSKIEQSKITAGIAASGRSVDEVLSMVKTDGAAGLTVGSAKAIRQILDGGKE